MALIFSDLAQFSWRPIDRTILFMKESYVPVFSFEAISF
jgi:hypothetical protein